MTGFPSLSPAGERRQARLDDARLMVVVATGPDLEELTATLCAASADVVRLRDDEATEDDLRRAADGVRRACDRAGALFVLERLPGLAAQVGADGVHLATVDVDPDHARRVLGPDLLVGRAVHDVDELSGSADEDVDYLVLDSGLLDAAVSRASHPWFVSVGDDPGSAGALVERGAGRLVADERALADGDVAEVCWQLRRAVGRHHR